MVDLEESQQQRRTVVKRGINEDLDRVKDTYDSMDEVLSRTAVETVPELPEGMPVPSLSVVYIPQLGFHITMPLEEANDLAARRPSGDWERMFVTDTGAYFKNDKMRTMDQELGDLWAIICDIEIEISHGLAERVLEKEDFLVEASELCGELDSLLALAHGACEYKLSRPRMVEENIIDIKAGRHLIQELTVASYVANDAFLVGGDGPKEEDIAHDGTAPEYPNMLLLTGPNYSGKSVFLKQVALISYMAQVGSFVPAERATLGITDKIMTRITTRETVSRGQSSFMIDLQQISWALKAFTHRSLLVIDEFGKGTDNCDGAGLCAGVFHYLLTRGSLAPKVLASTHFHEIFEQGIISEQTSGLGLRQMEVHVRHRNRAQDGVGNHNIEVTYLYNVRPGRSKLSYGAQCAAMSGIPSSIVKRACELEELAMTGEDLVSICASVTTQEMADLEGAEAVSRAFLALDLDALTPDEVTNFKSILDELISNSSAYTTIGRTSTGSMVELPRTPT